MKKRLALAAGALLLPSIAFAGELTNPALSIPTGKYSLGFEYFFNNSNYEPSDSSFKKVRAEANQVYARGAYSAFDGNEVFIKLGGADLKASRAFKDDSDFDPGFDFSAAVGIKQSYEVMPNIRVGGIVQYTYFSDFEQSKTIGGTNQDLKATGPWQVDLALAAAYMGNGWAPYVGPVISWHRFEAHDDRTGAETLSKSTTYKESDVAGGVIGLDLWNGPVKGNVEVQISSQVSAGFTLNYLFP